MPKAPCLKTKHLSTYPSVSRKPVVNLLMMRCKFSIFGSCHPHRLLLRSASLLVREEGGGARVGNSDPVRRRLSLIHDGLVLVGLGSPLIVGLGFLRSALVAGALLAQEGPEQS